MKSSYNGQAVPVGGKAIGYSGGELQVPDTPIIPFIEGDGTGPDIWKASRPVFDAAVAQAYVGHLALGGVSDFAAANTSHPSNPFATHLPPPTPPTFPPSVP